MDPSIFELRAYAFYFAGEVAQLKHALSSIRRDIEMSCKKEMDEVKQKYNEKVEDMLQHIRNLDAELVEKGLLLNKTLRYTSVVGYFISA